MRITQAARTSPRSVFQGYFIGEVGGTRPPLIPGFVLNQDAFRRFFVTTRLITVTNKLSSHARFIHVQFKCTCCCMT